MRQALAGGFSQFLANRRVVPNFARHQFASGAPRPQSTTGVSPDASLLTHMSSSQPSQKRRCGLSDVLADSPQPRDGVKSIRCRA